ncbi:MAG: hypothetical protein F2813_01205 [Actinobacteria bacterium]|uniref:Unannotated protein n=1 Tax=freshwater metagenome TaxID=449393 RepID=A0A6J5Z6U5_9ZZZZ|nr:hypothetical protein [Actinomycetota bacterium]
MAQAKKKRSSKHRGNAAGIVETRGRTGRPLSDREQAKNKTAASGKSGGGQRPVREPSWRSAATRSVVAVVIFVAVLTLLLKQPVNAILPVALLMLVFYVPLSYYTDRWIYRRRLVKDAAAKKAKR